MPGAVETIAIVAFSGGLDVVFILTHHLMRMVVLRFAPALIVQARRWREMLDQGGGAGNGLNGRDRSVRQSKWLTPKSTEKKCHLAHWGLLHDEFVAVPSLCARN